MVVTTRSRTSKCQPSTPPKSTYPQVQPTPRTPATRTTRKRTPPKTPVRTRSRLPSRAPRGKKVSQLPSEYELDAEGRAIENPSTGCPKLSKYGWRVFEERTRHVEMVRPPCPELDGRLRPRHNGPHQPTLYYGIGCNMDEILAWQSTMPFKIKPDDPRPDETARHRLDVYLNSRRVTCSIERALSPDFEFVIALYSNYDQFERQLVKEDEERCIQVIWKQLGLRDGRPPMWWWDEVQSGTYYECPLDDYNVRNLYKITVPPEDDDWV